MKSFFKSYLLTVFIMFILLVVFLFAISAANSPFAVRPAYLLGAIIGRSLIFAVIYIVLMFIIALPLFAIVRKFTNFSALFAFLTAFLIHGAVICFAALTAGTSNMTLRAALGITIIGLVFGIIFALSYSWFKKREKPSLKKVTEIFQ